MSCLIGLIGNTPDDLSGPSEASQKVSVITARATRPRSSLAMHRPVCSGLSVQMRAKCLKATSQMLIPGPRGHAPTSQVTWRAPSGEGDVLGSEPVSPDGTCILLSYPRKPLGVAWPPARIRHASSAVDSAVDEPQRGGGGGVCGVHPGHWSPPSQTQFREISRRPRGC